MHSHKPTIAPQFSGDYEKGYVMGVFETDIQYQSTDSFSFSFPFLLRLYPSPIHSSLPPCIPPCIPPLLPHLLSSSSPIFPSSAPYQAPYLPTLLNHTLPFPFPP